MGKGLWVKLSVGYLDDERIMQVGPEAELLFVRGLAWAKRGGCGAVGAGALVRLGLGLSDPQAALQALTRVGLWQEDGCGGWVITGWDGWQGDHREVRQRAGAQGSHARWHKSPEPGCEWCMADGWQVPSVGHSKQMPEKEKERTTTAHRAMSVDGFDAWWKAWPKRVAKGQAMRAYRAALKRTDAATLLAGAERVAAEWAAMEPERRQFVPYPATWLNGDRWEDAATDQPGAVRVGPTVDPECPECGGEGIVPVPDQENTFARCSCVRVRS